MKAGYKMRLKKGDIVMVRSGKYKGRSGKITQVHPKENKITVEGINIVKRHVKPSRLNPQGGIVEVTQPLWAAKVGLYDPGSKRTSKVNFKVNKDGSKNRLYKNSGKEVK